jgi:hypothetical protein
MTPDQLEDIQHLTTTIGWPYWPFCSIKKNGVLACCYDGKDGGRVVYLKNLFLVIDEELDGVETIKYTNSYELVKDGWKVD